MKALFCILLAGLLAPGCAITARNAAELSPEQIQELRDQGHEIIKCFQICGPPPSGNTTIIVVPRRAIAKFKFSANCAIIEGSLETK